MVLRKPYETGVAVKSIDGLGPPKGNINLVTLTSMDGGLYGNTKVDARNIVFTFYPLESPDSVETNRQKIYKYFPYKKYIEVQVRSDNRVLGAKGYVESIEPSIFSDTREEVQVSMVCPDPYFYDLSTSDVTFVGVQPKFEFPFSVTESGVPGQVDLFEFGDIRLEARSSFDYEGDVDTGIVVTIHALTNVTDDIIIYNIDTYEQFKIDMNKIKQITGKVLQRSEDIYISTFAGDRFVRLYRGGNYINIIGAVDRNVDWIQLTPGLNEFTFDAGDFQKEVILTFNYKNAYVGI